MLPLFLTRVLFRHPRNVLGENIEQPMDSSLDSPSDIGLDLHDRSCLEFAKVAPWPYLDVTARHLLRTECYGPNDSLLSYVIDVEHCQYSMKRYLRSSNRFLSRASVDWLPQWNGPHRAWHAQSTPIPLYRLFSELIPTLAIRQSSRFSLRITVANIAIINLCCLAYIWVAWEKVCSGQKEGRNRRVTGVWAPDVTQ